MNDECLICKAPLEYLSKGIEMECSICGKRELSNTRCVNGHYVCDKCHISGMDAALGICCRSRETDPIAVLEKLMSQPFCHMHGPEHHSLTAMALITAYYNAKNGDDGDIESGDRLRTALNEAMRRGREVPGGACGFWGACGAGIGAGIFISVVTGATPLEKMPFALSNAATSQALGDIAAVGGPRCCKRNSYISILAASRFAAKELGTAMMHTQPICSRSSKNNQCLGTECPFFLNKI